jgi:hypothetical protein
MNRIAVSSSNIATVGYDSPSSTLEIEFHDGSVYQYFDVPSSIHNELVGAASVGGYFASNVKGAYRYART